MKNFHLVLVLLSTILFSCQKEEIFSDQNHQLEKNYFQAFNKSGLIQHLPLNFQVQWENYEEGFSEIFGEEIIEIPITSTFLNSSRRSYSVSHSLIIQKDKSLKLVELHHLTSDSELTNFLNIVDLKFNGLVTIYTSVDNILVESIFRNGRRVGDTGGDEEKSLNKYMTLDGCQEVTIHYWVDYINPYYPDDVIWSEIRLTSKQLICSPNEGYRDPSLDDSNDVIEKTEEKIALKAIALGEEDGSPENVIIDPSIYLHPCLAKVLNKVLESNSQLFEETIAQFIDNPKYDLIFTIGECKSSSYMCTDGSKVGTTGEITVRIEDPTQNPIDLVSQILHEAVHAEIFRYVNEHHEGNVDPNDKPRLFDYYKYYKLAVDQEQIDHPYMAKYYVTPIAEALRKMDNNQYDLEYYKVFAIDGLGNWGLQENDEVLENFGKYRNELTMNFNITCDD